MDNMDVILTLIGAFMSLIMTVIAYFTSKTLEKISIVELKLTELVVKHDSIDERSRNNENLIKKNSEQINSIKNNLIKLEA